MRRQEATLHGGQYTADAPSSEAVPVGERDPALNGGHAQGSARFFPVLRFGFVMAGGEACQPHGGRDRMPAHEGG